MAVRRCSWMGRRKVNRHGGSTPGGRTGGVRPYYDEQGITIFLGDCREVLPTLEAGSIDLVLTDPPYGVNLIKKTSDYRQSTAFDNGESLRASVLYKDTPEAVRALIATIMPEVLRIGRRAMVFCGPRMMWAYPGATGSRLCLQSERCRPVALGVPVHAPNPVLRSRSISRRRQGVTTKLITRRTTEQRTC
jgi:hypothetical protein